ncbi:MAG TPA: nicotinate phosphoribosyltransferase [Gaiellales bacterium]|nr:nicotinate phosphoribosyltransferase [Gaiellales bacterium]
MIAAAPTELLVDEYQLAMADSYLAQGIADCPVSFELFVRTLPPNRGYLIAAGLERAVEFLTGLGFGADALAYLERAEICSPALVRRLAEASFTGDVWAVPEGTVVHADEPIVRVEGDLLTSQLAETLLLNQVNFQTLIATKASRVVTAAGGRPVVDFGFRRAHGADAGLLAARAAYIGGCSATATVAAGYRWGIPTTGTMAHSYVLSFPSEEEAFAAFLADHPDRSTLLVDTRDAVAGAQAAVAAARRLGTTPQAVRLDSGDLVRLTREVRGVLDTGGLGETRIVCSGDLDEYRIADLLAAGAPIDAFGVGTALTTSSDAPALGGVYKLVEANGKPVMKAAGAKSNLPGRHQVFRDASGGDVIGLDGEELSGDALLQPVLRSGKPVGSPPPLAAARDRAAAEVAALPAGVRALRDPDTLPPRLSPRLLALKEELG